MTDLGLKVEFAEEENQSTWRKTIGVRLRSTNLSPHAKPENQSRVVEVGGVTDDQYANLTPVRSAKVRLWPNMIHGAHWSMITKFQEFSGSKAKIFFSSSFLGPERKLQTSCVFQEFQVFSRNSWCFPGIPGVFQKFQVFSRNSRSSEHQDITKLL